MTITTLPAGGQVIETRVAAEPVQARSVQVPLLWVGGPVGPLALKLYAGYARWTALQGPDAWNSVATKGDLFWELPMGPLVTSLGVTAQQWFPIGPAPVRYMPGAWGFQAGARFYLLNLFEIEGSAWGHPDPSFNNLLGGSVGRAWGATGILRIGI
ncbi:MAG: hypothetical protein VKO21_09220 [Candidatus Sericytochromatia bacterium]|nr:hypothetical protein [Candidatus Sericytochromatia bacterium]